MGIYQLSRGGFTSKHYWRTIMDQLFQPDAHGRGWGTGMEVAS